MGPGGRSTPRQQPDGLWKYLVMVAPNAVAISGDRMPSLWPCPPHITSSTEGEVAWRYKAEKVPTSIALSSKGDLIAVATKEAVYLLDREGNGTWLYKTGGPARGVALDDRGRVAVGINASLFLLEGGKEVWRYEAGGPVKAVAMTGSGDFILLSTEDKVYLLDGGGKLVWDGDIGGILSLAISPNGSYVAPNDDHLSTSSGMQNPPLRVLQQLGLLGLNLTKDLRGRL